MQTRQRKGFNIIFGALLGVLVIASCAPSTQFIPSPTSAIPSSTLESTATNSPEPIAVFIDPLLPSEFRSQLKSSAEINFVQSRAGSQVQLVISDSPSTMHWVYALVAPFATVVDGITLADLKRAWLGDFSGNIIEESLEMTVETRDIFSSLWGDPSAAGVKVVTDDQLKPQPSSSTQRWVLIPFGSLDPKWKVLEVDGKSPLSKDFSDAKYSLVVNFKFTGEENALSRLNSLLGSNPNLFPVTNRDAFKLSVVMLTGTTALTRDIGKQMDAKGIMYPATDIMDWFRQADIIHISDEVSFLNGCVVGDRGKFCSKPEYLGLLTGIGTNVVELTGNHLLDFGPDPFLFTLDLFKQHQMPYYGGGSNLEDARKPLLLEDHGNKIAFLGCNYGNPPSDMATSTTPGANPCDNEWMKSTIQDLKEKGYLVIFTFQDIEVCTPEPADTQRGDFFHAAEAGANIVSGSQAHCPQAVTFHQGAFIHFGLGNLFFDMMDSLSRKEMVDLHYFYDGKYISAQFLTAVLEDSAKPRPMTPVERENLLYSIFEASVWEK